MTDDEFKQLEENILHDGIQDPLKIWKTTLIDGHNRYEIAQAHNLEFKTVEMQFATRDDAKIWIIKNQFGRRNLSAYDRSLLALKLKPVIAAKEIAKAAGVSHDTIAKAEKIEAQASPEIKAALKSGDLSINAAYNKVQQAKRKEDIQWQVEEIEQQVFEQPTGLFDVIVIDSPWGYVCETHILFINQATAAHMALTVLFTKTASFIMPLKSKLSPNVFTPVRGVFMLKLFCCLFFYF